MIQAEQITEKFELTPNNIDGISEKIAETLSENGLNKKDILRLRLSAEEVMNLWSGELGTDSVCKLIHGKRFGRSFLILSCEGKQVDPTQQDDEIFNISGTANMITAMGMLAEYRYAGGMNTLKINLPPKEKNPILTFLATIVCAVLVGTVFRFLMPEAGRSLDEMIISPVFNAIMRLIKLVAGPLVFFSVMSGILSIGDRSSFSKISRKLVGKILIETFVLSALVAVPFILIYHVDGGMGTVSGFSIVSSVFKPLLDIVPNNIIEPFETGNALQIVFMAVIAGIAGLIIKGSIEELLDVINQLNAIIQMIMALIAKILPAFIFLCIVDLIISNNSDTLGAVLVPFAVISVLNILFVLIKGIMTSVQTKIPLMKLLKTQFPSLLLSLITASSSAVYGLNVECCEKLGIDKKLINFSIPLGQVIYMPGVVASIAILSFYMSHEFGIPITVMTIFTIWLSSGLLAIASPPVPGGVVSVITVIFSQLGLPAEAVAFAAAVILFTDYFMTLGNIGCLQQFLYSFAYKMDLLTKKE